MLLHDLMDGDIDLVEIDYDPNGSLVTTHESQGTDMGLYGGLLGWQADDPRMKDYKQHIEEAGIEIRVNYLSYGAEHPNNYQIRISNGKQAHIVSAISTGGGMMQIWQIDAGRVEIGGDYHELLVFGQDVEMIREALQPESNHQVYVHRGFVEIKSTTAFSAAFISRVEGLPNVSFARYLRPVLPILARNDMKVPFFTCSEMLEYGKRENMDLWQLALAYEAARGAISEEEVVEKMRGILAVMKGAIEEGLQGTYYEDRILPAQSPGYREKMESNQLLDAGLLNTIVLYTTSMMEVKSSMGVFVAAPTAGSCGTLPGAILGAVDVLGLSDDEAIKALLAAGMIGVFIAQHATFAAEVAGCQAETGAGGSMAAAGLVTLMGGTLDQCVGAASLALQNSLGIVCDPIANRVEAPCLGKNIMAASNALTCANMALANYEHLIPLDEVIESMNEVGRLMAHELTCTGLGGLAATPTSKKIAERLKEKAKYC